VAVVVPAVRLLLFVVVVVVVVVLCVVCDPAERCCANRPGVPISAAEQNSKAILFIPALWEAIGVPTLSPRKYTDLREFLSRGGTENAEKAGKSSLRFAWRSLRFRGYEEPLPAYRVPLVLLVEPLL
jgi:hypothetical protein